MEVQLSNSGGIGRQVMEEQLGRSWRSSQVDHVGKVRKSQGGHGGPVKQVTE
jgi:hypothetical protein